MVIQFYSRSSVIPCLIRPYLLRRQARTTSKVSHDDKNAIMHSAMRDQTVQVNQQIIESPVFNSNCCFNCYIVYSTSNDVGHILF
jgi:hypothetical protein